MTPLEEYNYLKKLTETPAFKLSKLAHKHDLSLTANGCLFKRDARGFLPELAEEIYNDRLVFKAKYLELKKKYKETKDVSDERAAAKYKHLQDAYKVLLNSGYGALSNRYFRWYEFDFAEAITSSGQLAIRWVADRMNEFMNDALKTTGVDYIIASDTDSIYVNMSGLAESVDALDAYINQYIQPLIDDSYKKLADMMNAYQQKMVMKREKISSVGIWKACKNYVLYVVDSEGVRYKEPEVEITGIEAVRSSTPLVSRKYIEEALKIILSRDNDALIDYINEKRVEFKTKSFDQVAFPRGVKFRYGATKNRGAGTYTLETSGVPIQVRAALLYNKLLREMNLTNHKPITDSDKIKFTYLKTPNPIGENVIAAPAMLPKEFGLDAYVDHETQFEKTFLEPIRSICEVLDWRTERIATLEDFF